MDLEQKAIERIRTASEMSLHHYGEPLVCTYSGGKDSDVMLELFKRSGVPFEVSHGLTTVDAPQTVRHIKDMFKHLENEGIKAQIDYHTTPKGKRVTMWRLIERNGIPTRKQRFCCKYLKENTVRDRMIATGVRWAESMRRRETRDVYEASARRAKDAILVSDEKMLLNDNDNTRKLIERCALKGKTVVNPIIDWPDSEIWDFYWRECPSHNPLYNMGYNRVGCIGCPLSGKKRWKAFANFPMYQEAYIRAFDRFIARKGDSAYWKTGYDVFLWWMEDQNVEGQISLEDYMNTL